MKKGIIVQGSSRSDGDTAKIVSYLKNVSGFDIIDLNQRDIKYFDYEFQNQDDFEIIFKNIVQNYQTIVLATPVYWYTMSGIMKVFLDRISDYLYKEKEYGRMLRGKEMAMMSCSNDDDRVDEFNLPFSRSAEYLGMEYLGDIHTWVKNQELPIEVKEKINAFALNIKN
ncbi:flavodoxin family protein [Aquimarina sp. 2201CG14-23]|uniref:flavodoxin family protein n=1 Tax=Aquimarina mycalae TaxID=3040073 RepID=UPI002477F69D|nr:NAD(P)H-dependent oxidoreductase [Aquimarina sp. 2201CG14-23]MDH7447313.1 NAD(P)H-dependent oxidoreductase [Aquimarina sp. 2201CG14-23]